MKQIFQQFWHDQDGATTVDWVLLTAGVMSLTLAVMSAYGEGARDISQNVSSSVAARAPATTW